MHSALLSKKQGSEWNSLWGHALKRPPGIIRKSRVLYSDPGFLFSATWHLLPKKYFHGFSNQYELVNPFKYLGLTLYENGRWLRTKNVSVSMETMLWTDYLEYSKM